MCKTHSLKCTSLHSLPDFSLKNKNILVGNGQYASVLFITPVILDIHDHRFGINTLVSKVHENVDLVLGIKQNIFKLEGINNSG